MYKNPNSKRGFQVTISILSIVAFLVYLGYWTQHTEPREPIGTWPITNLEIKECMRASTVHFDGTLATFLGIKHRVYKISQADYLRYAYTLYNIPIYSATLRVKSSESYVLKREGFRCDIKTIEP